MKSKILTFLLFGLITSLTAQENPFEEYGYTPKIATLSKGKYIEYFDRDSIVQIGNYVFNTVTQKIVGFVEEDTARGEYTLQPDLVSKWISPDPLASEAPGWTPYRFGFCNPIYYTDPTGLFETEFGVDSKGNVKQISPEDNKPDQLFALNEDGTKNTEVKPITIEDKTLLPQLTQSTDDAIQKDWITGDMLQGHYSVTSNGTEAKKAFMFLSNNSNVEWTFQGNLGKKFLIGTLHENAQAFSTYQFEGFERKTLKFHIHSHPNATRHDFKVSGPDQYHAEKTWKINPDAKYFIYAPKLTKATWNKIYPDRKINYEPQKFIKYQKR